MNKIYDTPPKTIEEANEMLYAKRTSLALCYRCGRQLKVQDVPKKRLCIKCSRRERDCDKRGNCGDLGRE